MYEPIARNRNFAASTPSPDARAERGSMADPPFTPETLAVRWGCSAEKIRTMCRNGEINFFKLGKLIRIPAIEVERIECRMDIALPNTAENGPSPQDLARICDDVRLARMI